jgi:Phospholipid-translocating ATPase N-terminal
LQQKATPLVSRLVRVRLLQTGPLAVPDIDSSGTHSRYIPWNHHKGQSSQKFDGNSVSTAKYDPYFVTFIPLFLFEMFSRVAYLYFLIQVRQLHSSLVDVTLY